MMRLKMISQKLFRHYKNIDWYCVFQYGRCYLLYTDKRFVKLLMISGIILQYEKQENIFEAMKYLTIYNKGVIKK